jgi:hypothetical protein
MPAERLSMRKVREVLRLKYACGVSARVISRSLGIGRTAVAEYIRRAAVIGVTWPIWPAPGSEDTELGVSMEPEVDHGEAEVHTRVQA